jgi:hypothetical protein
MPVIYVHRYDRRDAQANPGVLYLFGDNDIRKGYGGQAAAMRDEPNAVGVRTKYAPGTAPSDFFSDADFDDATAMINNDLVRPTEHLMKGGTVVIPLDGLGSGLSELPQRAPRVNHYLMKRLALLAIIGA